MVVLTDTPSYGQTPAASVRQTAMATSLFVDNIAKTFELTDEQTRSLHELVEVTTKLPGQLEPADIMSRCYMVSCQYGSENRILRAVSTAPGGLGLSSSQTTRVLQDISVMMEDSFAITPAQRTAVRLVGQHLICKPGRTSYKELNNEVEKILREQPKRHNMQNIFGQPTREAVLGSDIRTQMSGVRNKFRALILESLVGEKHCSLEAFVARCCKKYSIGLLSNMQAQSLSMHLSLLRRVTWENKNLSELPNEVETTAATANADEEMIERPRKRQKKGRGGGRVSQEDDFWAQIEAWFAKQLDLRGKDFSSPLWKEYIRETLNLEQERFKSTPSSQPANPMLEPQDSSSDAFGSSSTASSRPSSPIPPVEHNNLSDNRPLGKPGVTTRGPC
ncbi:hypothetical protein D9613_009475 [Agrocybe pediades]|uniref:Uncharacterized protein n=1 Tax=Agrocybe pediades TaxID=84607 RepID=A0A8H4R667_9AGAR|nr:hypothetical protein D9613_009475 [Agrocybe pediades]